MNIFNKKNNDNTLPMFLAPPPPKTKEYKTIFELLDQAEMWRNAGDFELEKQVWKLISERALRYHEECLPKETKPVSDWPVKKETK